MEVLAVDLSHEAAGRVGGDSGTFHVQRVAIFLSWPCHALRQVGNTETLRRTDREIVSLKGAWLVAEFVVQRGLSELQNFITLWDRTSSSAIA